MNNEPQRIQRRRISGWTMPPNTVYVGRPGRWGNPFRAEAAEEAGYRDGPHMAAEAFRGWLRGDSDWQWAPAADQRKTILEHIGELRGKNLACWCKPGAPCHADVLLALANKRSEQK